MSEINNQRRHSLTEDVVSRVAESRARLSFQRIVCAALLLLASFLGLIAYSYDPILLAMGLCVYAAVLYWRPAIWLFLLPPIMGWLNLAPWSGSFFLEEFDLFIPITVAVLIVRDAYVLDKTTVPKLGWMGLILYFVSWVISLTKGLFPLSALDANAFASYYSHYNGLRIAKSFLWGLMLWPAVSHAYRHSQRESIQFFSWGMAIAVFGVGLIALWERGAFVQLLYSHDIYAIVNTILNFSTHYRITGLFEDMHTGGEAIDGFLALTLPFALYAAFHGGGRVAWLAGAVTVILGFYAAAVTFSRTTYFAAVVIVAVLAAFYLLNSHRGTEKFPILAMVGVIAAFALLALEYKNGGSILLASGEAGCAGAIALGFYYGRLPYGFVKRRLIFLGWIALGLFAAYGSARGMLTSKWVHNDLFAAIAVAIVTGLVTSLSGAWLGAKLSGVMTINRLLVMTMLLVGAGTTVIPALFGFRMEARLSHSAEDFTTRYDHWRDSLAVMDSNASTYLIGEGLGRFPDIFFWRNAINEVGMYRFQREGSNQFLTLRGGPDLRYGQRVALDANKNYTLSFDARTHNKSLDLRIRICRRNIIEPYDWNPECIKFTPDVRNKQGEWHHYIWKFDMGTLGDGYRLGRKPLMFELSNLRMYKYKLIPPTLVDIDNLSIKDSLGGEHLRNGDFERGARAWYPYFDFKHLPWHTKNFWVGLYFGQGILGVLGMSLMVLAALRNGFRRVREYGSFVPNLIAALAGFLAVGLFGTLVDVPRIMTLFYIILFSLLTWPSQNDLPAVARANAKFAP